MNTLATGSRMLSAASEFFSWWVSDLEQLIPERLRRPEVPTLVRAYDGGFSVHLPGTEDNRGDAHRFTWMDAGLSEAERQRLLALCGDRPVHLSLSEEDLYFTTLRLPSASSEHLRKAASYQLYRESPLDPDETLFGIAKKPRRNGARLEVDAVIARAVRVTQLRTALTNLGCRVACAGYAEPGHASLSYELTDPAGAKLVTARSKWHSLLRWSGVFAAALALLATYVAANIMTRQVENRIAMLSQREAETERLYARQVRARAIASLDVDVSGPPATALLNELAQRIPKDAWLVELRREGQAVKLVGLAQNATAVTQSLLGSTFFATVKLDNVQMPADPSQPARFELLLDLRKEGRT